MEVPTLVWSDQVTAPATRVPDRCQITYALPRSRKHLAFRHRLTSSLTHRSSPLQLASRRVQPADPTPRPLSVADGGHAGASTCGPGGGFPGGRWHLSCSRFSNAGTGTNRSRVGYTARLNSWRVVAPNRGAAPSGPNTTRVVRSRPSRRTRASPTSYSANRSSANSKETVSIAWMPRRTNASAGRTV